MNFLVLENNQSKNGAKVGKGERSERYERSEKCERGERLLKI